MLKLLLKIYKTLGRDVGMPSLGVIKDNEKYELYLLPSSAGGAANTQGNIFIPPNFFCLVCF